MNFFALSLYGLINAAMVLSHLARRTRIYEFPFWAGLIALGWFFPQAIGGLYNIDVYPAGAYFYGMLFASLCTVSLWCGHAFGIESCPDRPSWLSASFDVQRLVMAGSVLCAAGFFFQWKLTSLPDEMLAQTQWTGAAVKYLFFGSVFQFGFLSLWLIYLRQSKWNSFRLLAFIVPGLFLLFKGAFINGRRSEMMNLVAYVLVCVWFSRRWLIPRWIMITGLAGGLLIVNSIGMYRNVMAQRDMSLAQRLRTVARSNLASEVGSLAKKSGAEFNNYIFFRQACVDESILDWGLSHWNGLVFNYVPAQLVGRGLKNSLMFQINGDPIATARTRYGHTFGTGSTATGYLDAYASFQWGGFIKFGIIGWIMGVLYRHAMMGHFLGQLLYVYLLSDAMHSITHGTHTILVSKWVYFFALGYPLLLWAKTKKSGTGFVTDLDEVYT